MKDNIFYVCTFIIYIYKHKHKETINKVNCVFLYVVFTMILLWQNKEEVLVDEWSKQARDLLLGFAEKINLPNRYNLHIPNSEIMDVKYFWKFEFSYLFLNILKF